MLRADEFNWNATILISDLVRPWLGAAFATLAAASASALADPVADFYKGKQMTLLVGSDPGGGYDLLARLVARHLGDFIPGAPKILVENMPGAGSVLLSNRVYNIAPRDGTFIGLVQRGVLISQLTNQNGVHYDLAKFNWIGNVSTEISLVTAWKASPINSIQDVLKREMVVGGTGATADSEASARVLNGLAGAKFKIVSGYPGTADVVLAMQRGELEGLADLSWSEIKSKNATMLATGDFKFLAQNALAKAPDLPNVPLSIDLVTDPADRPVAELYYAMKGVARPILAAPGVPPDRVAALRAAFDKMVLDADFQNDWRSSKLDLNPTNYKTIEAFVSRATAATSGVRDRLTEILSPKR